MVDDRQGAGLLKPSVFKPVIAIIENIFVLRKLRNLISADCLTPG